MTFRDALLDTNKRFVVVVQGGGMRGAYSAGALACFDHHELQPHIRAIVGGSTGAMNAAYFVAGQPGAVNIYTSLLSNKQFVDLLRPRKKMDIDYMVDVALHKEFPIDIEALKASPVELDIVVTDARSGAKEVINKHQAFSRIYEEFRATSALPVLYDKKVPLMEHYYIDGGVSDLLPVDVALKHEPTDIIVIMTRPLSYYTRPSLFKPSFKRLMRRAAKYQSAAIRDMLPTNEAALKKNISLIKAGSTQGVRIHLLAPRRELKVGIASIDSVKLESVAEAGWQEAENFLTAEYSHLPEVATVETPQFVETHEPPTTVEKLVFLDPAPRKLPKRSKR